MAIPARRTGAGLAPASAAGDGPAGVHLGPTLPKRDRETGRRSVILWTVAALLQREYHRPLALVSDLDCRITQRRRQARLRTKDRKVEGEDAGASSGTGRKAKGKTILARRIIPMRT